MLDSIQCISCQKPKANLKCGICESPICKKCAEQLPEGSFSFYLKVPENLTYLAYCSPCFNQNVVEAQEIYEEIMDRAKRVFVFYKGKDKEARNLSRSEKTLKVEGCDDKDEVLLRLAFLAAKGGFNTLVDVVVDYQKVRDEGYQTTKWMAMGVPVKSNFKR